MDILELMFVIKNFKSPLVRYLIYGYEVDMKVLLVTADCFTTRKDGG